MTNGLRKTRRLSRLVFFCFVYFNLSFAFAYSWQEGEQLPLQGLANPYYLKDEDFKKFIRAGRLHALHWPVEVTGALIPFRPTLNLIDMGAGRLGLHPYPKKEGEGPYFIPFKNGSRPNYRMGFSLIEKSYPGKGRALGYTFSCAACHSSDLFGRKVIGLSNRFPGANEVFAQGLDWVDKVSPDTFQFWLGGTSADKQIYTETRENLQFVEAKKPVTKGLDTSLAHVALSLSHRAPDAWASKGPQFAENPRPEKLRQFVADTKPAVWWNVKYKNKWLLDGSVVSGNPILTNIIWNEIGRGTDLHELNQWFNENQDVIQELTTAVYSAEAPPFTDFFDFTSADLKLAQQGEQIFNQRCTKCHGEYIKKWNETQPKLLRAFTPVNKLIETVEVRYFADTPIKDVGTDPQRWQGMESLLQLNKLAISEAYGIKIKLQQGYVPPPLVGIWARFPYFHNNSVPNLCELLKPANKRVVQYWAGDLVDKKRHFDRDCNGYPTGRKAPQEWVSKTDQKFDTRRPGQSQVGHDKDFADFSDQDRRALIRFLQTL